MRGIILAFPDQKTSAKIRDILTSRGLPVRGMADSGSAVLRLSLLEDHGGVIICAPRFSDMTAYQMFTNLSDVFDVLVLSTCPSEAMDMSANDGLYYMAAPIFAEELTRNARALLETRQMTQSLTRRRTRTKDVFDKKSTRSKEEQEWVEKAKLHLMKNFHYSEEEAHRYLQKESMQKGLKMPVLAEQIVRQTEGDRA